MDKMNKYFAIVFAWLNKINLCNYKLLKEDNWLVKAFTTRYLYYPQDNKLKLVSVRNYSFLPVHKFTSNCIEIVKV